jgi:purine-binding chemotaxis protein CheW
MSEFGSIEQGGDVPASAQLHKYLTFVLGEVNYGLDIQFVREIIGMQSITVVPDVPSFIRGVINLRGKVIPVMDVRRRFHMEGRPYDDRTCIVVVHVGDWLVGLVVDTVSEVLDIPAADIEPPPEAFGLSHQRDHFIAGMVKVGDQVRMLIDARRLLGRSGTPEPRLAAACASNHPSIQSAGRHAHSH